MNKKLGFYLLLLVFLMLVSGRIIYSHYVKSNSITGNLPHVLLNSPEVNWLNRNSGYAKKTIVLFFHPECEHCQYEAKTIVQQKEAFKDVNLWWVSIADTVAVKAFSKQYGLDKLSNAYMATLPAEKIISTFGSSAIPHLFIYDEQENLLKEFKGETKVEALLKYLK